MELGTFSVSLTVKDIAVSRKFYETLGFEVIDGKQEDNWLILRSGSAIIGIFQDMFEENILTFHPDDARSIEKHLKDNDIPLILETEGETGAAHFILKDPDGNTIMFDQHDHDK